ISNSCWVKAMIWASIQWPETTMTRATPASLGTKLRVTSWIWVTDCSSDTPRPMARLTTRIGPASLAVTRMAWMAISTTAEAVTASPEAREEGVDDEGPAVDHDEQQELERQRHQHRRQHHHAHRHQRRADDEVDDEE